MSASRETRAQLEKLAKTLREPRPNKSSVVLFCDGQIGEQEAKSRLYKADWLHFPLRFTKPDKSDYLDPRSFTILSAENAQLLQDKMRKEMPREFDATGRAKELLRQQPPLIYPGGLHGLRAFEYYGVTEAQWKASGVTSGVKS